MAVLGMLEDEYATVSTVEIEAPDSPYTFETVERLRAAFEPGDAFFFIMGADSFEELMSWREPERILEGCNLIVAARPGHEVATSHLPVTISTRVVDLRGCGGEAAKTTAPRGEIYLTDYVIKDISSTEIRKRAREGGDLGGLVPPLVANYISRYGVYRR
jgi:nicotinate-nucleotide adenylyltransferase